MPSDSPSAHVHAPNVHALILAGGSGTRFWPLSRRARPKQLLALDGPRSLLQATVDRLAPDVPPARVWICTTAALQDAIRAQLPDVPTDQVLVEPEGRNTAPAIGWSIHRMRQAIGDDIVAVLPADHRIADPRGFRGALAAAARIAVDDDRIVTLGVRPRWAETGYGYLELGDALASAAAGVDARRVARFREKPDADTAQRYFNGGNHLWNAGIFVFRGTTLLRHLARLQPAMAEALEGMADDPDATAARYGQLESISIDYAVMEHLDDIGTVPLDAGWSDLGSWSALDEVLEADADTGSVLHGDALAIDAPDNLIYAEDATVAVVGVSGLAVIQSGDAVLVLPKERAQDVRRVVEMLRAAGRDDRL
ncbi:MAG: sugar phosphate nucleotidyltransferase [Acidobacteriota bacterium]